MPRHSSRHGFTLLELSIVIAIIGLLVGGVLATQSYIASAQRTTAVNESKMLLNAFEQFRQKYNAIPGDMSTASSVWSGAPNGDGNGFVMQGAYGGGGADNVAEHFYVFNHLALAGFITGSYTGVAGPGGPGHCVPGSNIMASSIPNSGFYFTNANTPTGYVTDGGASMYGGYYGTYLVLGATTGTVCTNQSLISAPVAYELDSKFDNGKPGTGWMRGPTNSARPNCVTSNDKHAADYVAADNGPQCFFYLTPR